MEDYRKQSETKIELLEKENAQLRKLWKSEIEEKQKEQDAKVIYFIFVSAYIGMILVEGISRLR